MQEAQKHPNEIARIQAGFRGYKARKEFKEIKKQNGGAMNSGRNKPRSSGRRSNRQPDPKNAGSYARQLDEMPDYSNPATKATEAKLGKFDYDQPSSPSSKNLIERGPYELDNGAIYVGEWTKDGLRHGRGL